MTLSISRVGTKIRERNNKSKDVRKRRGVDVKMNERVNRVS
jgi:hypothetical protein